jgi:hypothetical protein
VETVLASGLRTQRRCGCAGLIELPILDFSQALKISENMVEGCVRRR